MEIKEVKIQRILNPTSINLGEYVINPFRGCVYGCLYCYVRSNKSISHYKQAWGSYVEVRINAAELLEKELLKKKPKRILLGSTTDCFQPIEKKYNLTRKIISILNEQSVFYNILTRSPYCVDFTKLFLKGFCENIYFTLNSYSLCHKKILEPASPAFSLRLKAVYQLHKAGIPVIPYISPVLPWLTDLESLFSQLSVFKKVSFEALNFNHPHFDNFLLILKKLDEKLAEKYYLMKTDAQYYNKVWDFFKEKIKKWAFKNNKEYSIYLHKFGGYFSNLY